MNILVLSFYFEPDLSAGSFRNTALVKALDGLVPSGSQIDVITTLPNRYSEYTVDAPLNERWGVTNVTRVQLPKHNSGMLDQSKSFLFYARAVQKATSDKRYDIVFASSSRLMTALLGSFISKSLKTPLYLDIRDIFVDTIKDVLPSRVVWLLTPIFNLLEKLAINQAKHINLVSGGFEEYFLDRYKNISLSFFTNGIDNEFLTNNILLDSNEISQAATTNIVYAGNIGEGQGLHQIVPQIAKILGSKVKFKIIGSGGRLENLKRRIVTDGIKNIEILAPMNRADLIFEYQKADVLFLHLNDYDAFKKVLPSKVFEYGAMGKPILAGVAGYAAKFIEEHIDNAEGFSPCSVDQAILSVGKLVIKTEPRVGFIKQFTRKDIMEEMALDVISKAEVKS